MPYPSPEKKAGFQYSRKKNKRRPTVSGARPFRTRRGPGSFGRPTAPTNKGNGGRMKLY